MPSFTCIVLIVILWCRLQLDSAQHTVTLSMSASTQWFIHLCCCVHTFVCLQESKFLLWGYGGSDSLTDRLNDWLDWLAWKSPFWENNTSLHKQEIPCILGKSDVYYCSHNVPVHSILSQRNSLHVSPSCYFKMRLIINNPPMPSCPKYLHFFKYSKQNFVCFYLLSHVCIIPHSHHNPPSNHPSNICWRVQIM